jgi:hypothetical protein
MNRTGGTSIGSSEAPITTNFPFTARPPRIALIAFPLGTVPSMTLAPPRNECWVFCKILYGIAQKYDIRFKEIHSSKGVAVFKAIDSSFHIIYQARYNTKWRDQANYRITISTPIAINNRMEVSYPPNYYF